ncbi:MAG: hypothetical protein LBQ34_04160 [Alphaproteobacteria bacterium]|jgi:hypothetical protein|nr:hypothetical protein [Alphaproteobacteria bacterium]
MKKILFTIIFSLFAANLMAQGNNSIIVGFGGANNKVQISERSQVPTVGTFSPFVAEPDFNANSNVNLAYLKQTDYLNGNLSLGADFTMFFSKGRNIKEDQPSGTSTFALRDTSTFYSSTFMFLADYGFLYISKLTLSAQLGAGFILNTLNINRTTTFYNNNGDITDSVKVSGNGTSGGIAGKAGLVATYNMFDRLAFGAGAYYMYTGNTEKNNLGGTATDYRFRNNGTMIYNINVIWRF